MSARVCRCGYFVVLVYNVLGPGVACPVVWGFPRRTLRTLANFIPGLLSLWNIHLTHSPRICLLDFSTISEVLAFWFCMTVPNFKISDWSFKLILFLRQDQSKWAKWLHYLFLKKIYNIGYIMKKREIFLALYVRIYFSLLNTEGTGGINWNSEGNRWKRWRTNILYFQHIHVWCMIRTDYFHHMNIMSR